MFDLIFECGMDTVSWCAVLALRRRVSISAIGSVIVMSESLFLAVVSAWDLRRSGLPAALGDARELTAVSHVAEAHAAQAELAVHGVRASALLAPGVSANSKLLLPCRLHLERGLCHRYFSLKGKPSCLSSERPSSSVVAVVTTVMSIPRTRSILSWSSSWNIDCSVRPKV